MTTAAYKLSHQISLRLDARLLQFHMYVGLDDHLDGDEDDDSDEIEVLSDSDDALIMAESVIVMESSESDVEVVGISLPVETM